MKKLLLISLLLVLLPFTLTADDDARGDKGVKSGKFVLHDSDGRIVGNLVDAWNWGGRVWFDFKRHSAIFSVSTHEILVTSWPGQGPILFFENEDCDDSGGVYTRPELIDNGWVRPRVIVAPGIGTPPDEPSFERFAYAPAAPDIAEYSVRSDMDSAGFCNTFPPHTPHVWKVEKIKACKGEGGYDLHWCYPPPYDITDK